MSDTASLDVARSEEQLAKARLTLLQRHLRDAKAHKAASDLALSKRAAAASVRVLKADGASREAREALASERRATEADVRSLAALLNSKLADLFPPPDTPSWFKLFRHVDDNSSGKIAFAEFVHMVRVELMLGPRELSNQLLRSVWLAVDVGMCGWLCPASHIAKLSHNLLTASTSSSHTARAQLCSLALKSTSTHNHSSELATALLLALRCESAPTASMQVSKHGRVWRIHAQRRAEARPGPRRRRTRAGEKSARVRPERGSYYQKPARRCFAVLCA